MYHAKKNYISDGKKKNTIFSDFFLLSLKNFS